jgi:hypothetical protein
VSVFLFVGPTLAAADARAALDATCLPPVRQGDVVRLVSARRPRAIGIVDGYFQHVPSLWHKEVLWALARGVHVFGAASMGALRAAELADFGMRGVGRIFEAYRSGRFAPYADPFEDDDEVAVIHGPAELGFAPLSTALVDIRATLARAAEADVLAASTRDRLLAAAKALFYHERSLEGLPALGRAQGLPEGEIAALEAWLPAARVDQKRADALAMLEAMRDVLAGDPPLPEIDWRFAPTTLWQRVVAAAGHVEDLAGGPGAGEVLDELRLADPEAFRRARRAALARLLALGEPGCRPASPARGDLERTVGVLRRRAGLFGRAAIERWLADNDLELPDFDRLAAEEARLVALERDGGAALDRHLLDHLRLEGTYAALAARARAKRTALAGGQGRGDDGGARLAALLWFCRQRLGREVPDDALAFARELGFADLGALHRALVREYRFATIDESRDPA